MNFFEIYNQKAYTIDTLEYYYGLNCDDNKVFFKYFDNEVLEGVFVYKKNGVNILRKMVDSEVFLGVAKIYLDVYQHDRIMVFDKKNNFLYYYYK